MTTLYRVLPKRGRGRGWGPILGEVHVSSKKTALVAMHWVAILCFSAGICLQHVSASEGAHGTIAITSADSSRRRLGQRHRAQGNQPNSIFFGSARRLKQSACQVENCEACHGSAFSCYLCQPGFNFEKGPTSPRCVPDSACKVKNCAVCRASPLNCYRCEPGFEYHSGQNSSLCVPKENPDLACKVKNCAACRGSSLNCYICKPGYTHQRGPTSSLCVKDITSSACKVKNCAGCSYSAVNCDFCEPGFLLQYSDTSQKCKAIFPPKPQTTAQATDNSSISSARPTQTPTATPTINIVEPTADFNQEPISEPTTTKGPAASSIKPPVSSPRLL